mgnify:FL=1
MAFEVGVDEDVVLFRAVRAAILVPIQLLLLLIVVVLSLTVVTSLLGLGRLAERGLVSACVPGKPSHVRARCLLLSQVVCRGGESQAGAGFHVVVHVFIVVLLVVGRGTGRLLEGVG